MIIIIVFVYFFDSTCCVTWESIGIFCFVFVYEMYLNRDEWDCLRARVVSFSREKMSAQKSERDRLMSFCFVYDVCISISERVKSNRIRSKWRRLLWFWMCVCLLCLEKLSSRLFLNPFRFLTCFCLFLLVVLFSLHIVCFLVYFLFINV